MLDDIIDQIAEGMEELVLERGVDAGRAFYSRLVPSHTPTTPQRLFDFFAENPELINYNVQGGQLWDLMIDAATSFIIKEFRNSKVYTNLLDEYGSIMQIAGSM